MADHHRTVQEKKETFVQKEVVQKEVVVEKKPEVV
jgi:hypothetical protein